METTGVMGCVPSVVGLIQAKTQRNGPEGGTTNRFAPLNERTVPWYWFGWKSYIRRRMYIYFCFCLKWFEFKLNLIRGLQNSAKHINYFTLQPQSQVPTKVSISLSHPFRWYSYWNQTVLVINNDPRCSYMFHFLEICIVYKTWKSIW